MDNRTIFVLTLRGQGEAKNHTSLLSGDIKRALTLIDDKSTVAELSKRAAPSLRSGLDEMLQELVDGGFIQDKAKVGSVLRMATPKMTTQAKTVEEEGDELDFTRIMHAPSRENLAAEAAKLKAQAETEAKAQAEAKARADAATKAKQEAEAARLKMQQEATAAKAKAQFEAAQAKAAAETRAKAKQEEARIKAEQEAAAAKAQLEIARAKAEAEAQAAAKAHAEAEAKAKHEAQAKQEAEAARLKAEQEAAAARAQLEAVRAKAEAEAQAEKKARAEAEDRAKQEIEAARLKAEQEAARLRAEAEAVRIKAEQEAAKARADMEAARLEAERVRAELEAAKAHAEQEAARIKVEQEAAAAKLQQEAEAVRLKAEQEALRVAAEVEAKAQAIREAETLRLKAEEEAALARAEAEALRLQAEQEAARVQAELAAAKAKAEAETMAQREAEAARLKAEDLKAQEEQARIKSEADEQARQAAAAKAEAESAHAAKIKAEGATTRSMIATVLFFDVVGYTKQPVSRQIELKELFNKLVSEFIKDIDENQRIILDTGDGAAIGFLQHPEHAIEVALQFRQAVTANNHQDYPDLMVRMGIHLGPVNVVKDMNGQSNMVGDGINDAQRIMSFAGSDHIYISRAYYDVVSRLSSKYAKLFKYHGIENDKHGRHHKVYEVIDEQAGVVEQPLAQKKEDVGAFTIELEPFVLGDLGDSAAPVSAPVEEPAVELGPIELGPTVAQAVAHETEPIENHEPTLQAEAVTQETAELEARQKAARSEAERGAEAVRLKAEEEAAARKMAEEQAKTWAEAEQRAKAEAAQQAEAESLAQQQASQMPRTKIAKTRRGPMPLGKIIAAVFALALVLVAVLPYVWPMQDYIAQLEKKLSTQLHQPVHISSMKASVLPLPKLELRGVSVGDSKELRAGSVVLNFSLSALFAQTKAINVMELNDLALSAESFDQAVAWLQAAGADVHYPLARMMLRGVHVNGEGLNLPTVNGDADWDEQGRFAKAVLHSEDGKLKVELQAQQTGVQLALHIKESSLPLLPGVVFSELNAKGEVGADTASFNEIDGSIHGGILAGNARLSWQKGWQMQGHLSIKAMELHDAFPQYGIEGTLYGDADFLLNGAKFVQLANAPRLDGSFVARKGLINKIDFVETANFSGRRGGASGGRTHFDELSGVLQSDRSGQHFRQLKISTGVMKANGTVDIGPGKELSGRLSADLKMRAGSVPLVLSGTLTAPVLSAVR